MQKINSNLSFKLIQYTQYPLFTRCRNTSLVLSQQRVLETANPVSITETRLVSNNTRKIPQATVPLLPHLPLLLVLQHDYVVYIKLRQFNKTIVRSRADTGVRPQSTAFVSNEMIKQEPSKC